MKSKEAYELDERQQKWHKQWVEIFFATKRAVEKRKKDHERKV